MNMKTLIQYKYIVSAILALTFFAITSCEKNLEIKPDSSLGLSPEVAIKTPQDMQLVLNSCYDACANMMNGQLQILSDLMSDDIARPNNNDPFLTGIYNRSSDQFNGVSGSAYAEPYFTIYRANVMDRYYGFLDISEAEKNRMQGEAAFLRALCHFETVKLWAQPAGYTTNNSHLGIIERVRAKNEAIPRTSVASNYNLIINDLNKAINLLPDNNGVYANKNAAKALLAKVYFNLQNYTSSLTLVNEVIASGYSLSDSLNRFKRSEVESEIIFGFITTGSVYDLNVRGGTFKGMYRNDILSGEQLPILSISNELALLLTADSTDRRKQFAKKIMVGGNKEFFVTTKFNVNDFATPYLYLTDMLLIRAEIHALNNNTALAIQDLMPIIKRAYKPSAPKESAIAGLTSAALLDEIRLQRRLEMHCEGDRLAQAKRVGVSKGSGAYKIEM
jgi:starch-binding outer membrane protein, SusD/RagB family